MRGRRRCRYSKNCTVKEQVPFKVVTIHVAANDYQTNHTNNNINDDHRKKESWIRELYCQLPKWKNDKKDKDDDRGLSQQQQQQDERNEHLCMASRQFLYDRRDELFSCFCNNSNSTNYYRRPWTILAVIMTIEVLYDEHDGRTIRSVFAFANSRNDNNQQPQPPEQEQPDHNDDDQRNEHVDDHYENDNDNEILLEGWTMVQDVGINYDSWVRLVTSIRRQLRFFDCEDTDDIAVQSSSSSSCSSTTTSLLTLVTNYATTTVFTLSLEQVEEVWRILLQQQQQEFNTTTTGMVVVSSSINNNKKKNNHLALSHALQELVTWLPAVPPSSVSFRLVLQDAPTIAPTSIRSPSLPNHSCLPNVVCRYNTTTQRLQWIALYDLVMAVDDDDNNDIIETENTDNNNNNKDNIHELLCESWLDDNTTSSSTRKERCRALQERFAYPNSYQCTCPKCRYEVQQCQQSLQRKQSQRRKRRHDNTTTTNDDNTLNDDDDAPLGKTPLNKWELQRLGHDAMQRGHVVRARRLYQMALLQQPQKKDDIDIDNDDDIDDIWHALGATYLQQGRFRKAQTVWQQRVRTFTATTTRRRRGGGGCCSSMHCNNHSTSKNRHDDDNHNHHRHAGLALQWKKYTAYRYFDKEQKKNKSSSSSTIILNDDNDDRDKNKAGITSASFNTIIPPPAMPPYDYTNLFSWEGRLAFCTNGPIVPLQQCHQIISWAEDFATTGTSNNNSSSSNNNWTTNRHYAVPTCDVPVHDIEPLLQWFNNWMKLTVEPLLAHQFQLYNVTNNLFVHDAFVVKYQAAVNANDGAHDRERDTDKKDVCTAVDAGDGDNTNNNYLPCHYDESTHSLVLTLNTDFDGGGTYFVDQDVLVNPSDAGTLVSFCGNQVLHGGQVVTKGTRYVLAVFLYYDDNDDNDDDGIIDASSLSSCAELEQQQQDEAEAKAEDDNNVDPPTGCLATDSRTLVAAAGGKSHCGKKREHWELSKASNFAFDFSI